MRLFATLAALAVLLFRAAPCAAAAGLTLTIVGGEGAINNIRLRTARDPIVQVEDENHKPVAGATVVFTLPAHGAGGTFADGARTLITRTDNTGRAVARGFRPNQVQGRFQIRVNASFQGQTDKLTITQNNSATGQAATAGISAKIIVVLAVIAAAAAGGAVAATRSGDNGGDRPAQSATIGVGSGVTVGPPR